jgi:hypothetical protein
MGFLRFQSVHNRTVSGFSDGEFVRLRDEHGNVWTGRAEVQDEDIVRYHFRDSEGNMISGVSDRFGVVLRDGKGHTWRGVIY